MNSTTETQQRWVVNGNGRHDGDSTAMDSNGRRNRDLKAKGGLMAMGSNSTVMDGVAGRQWTVRRDVNGRCNGSFWQWTVRRLLDGDRARDSAIAMAMVMDCDHNGDGQQWTVMNGMMAT